MEQLAIPGGRADPVIGRILPRIIPDAVDLIGEAGEVGAATLWHRLAQRNDALTKPLAIAGAAGDDAHTDRPNHDERDGKSRCQEHGRAPKVLRCRERGRTCTHRTQRTDPVKPALARSMAAG